MTQVMVQPVSSMGDLQNAMHNSQNALRTDPYNTRVVLFINGQHYEVTHTSLCDGRLELHYDHSNPLD